MQESRCTKTENRRKQAESRITVIILALLLFTVIFPNVSIADTRVIGLTKDITNQQNQDVSSETLTFSQLLLGQDIEVAVYSDTTDTAYPLWGYGFELVYDPTVLELQTGYPQEQWYFIYGLYGGPPSDSTVFADTALNGRVQVACFVKDESDSLSSEGMMASFKFKTLKSAESSVYLENIYLFSIDPMGKRDTDPIAAAPYNGLSLELAQAQSSLSSFTVYPNPYRPNDGNSNTGSKYSSGNALSGIMFSGLTVPSQIEIYSISGERVLNYNFNGPGSQYNWDVKNGKGHDVVSGLYIYVITSNQGEKRKGKLMIIR